MLGRRDMPLVLPLHPPTVSNVAAERHRLPVAAPVEPWESAGTRLVPLVFTFPALAPALQRRCQANPPVVQHLPIDGHPPFRLFARRSVLARSSTDGRNGPAGDAGVASFSRASRAL